MINRLPSAPSHIQFNISPVSFSTNSQSLILKMAVQLFRPLFDTIHFCNEAMDAQGTLPPRQVRYVYHLPNPNCFIYFVYSTRRSQRKYATIHFFYPPNLQHHDVVTMLERALIHHPDMYSLLRRHCGLRRIYVRLSSTHQQIAGAVTRGMANRYNCELHRIFPQRQGWRVGPNNDYFIYEPGSLAVNSIPMHWVPAPLN